MNEKLINRIKSNKLFENIDISALNSEKIRGKFLTFSAGQMIFSEGSPSEYVYLIISGQVSLMRKTVLGGPEHLTFKQDDFFGMEELAEGTNRICTAVATEDSYVVCLTKDEIQALIDSDIRVQENIFKYSNIEKPEQEEKEEKEESKEPIPEVEQNNLDENTTDDVSEKTESSETNNSEETTEELTTKFIENSVAESIEDTDDFTDYLNPLGALEEPYSPAIDSQLIGSDIDLPPMDIDQPFDPSLEENNDNQINTPETFEEAVPENVPTEINESAVQEDILNDIPPDVVDNKEETPSNNFPDFDETLVDPLATPPIDITPEDPELTETNETEHIPQEETAEQPLPETEPTPEPESESLPQIDAKKYFDFFTALISAKNISELTSNFEDECAKLFDADKCVLFTRKESNLLEATIKGENGSQTIFQKMGEGISGLSSEIGEKIVIQDARRDSRIYSDVLNSVFKDIKNLLAIPFEEDEGGFVLIIINKSSRFDSDDEENARKLFNTYFEARNKFKQLNSTLAKEKKNFSKLMVEFLSKNIKSKAVLIKNYADHLLQKELKEEERGLGKLIKESAKEILDKLYFAAVIDESELNLRFVDISLNKRIEKFFSSYENYLSDKYCTVIMKLDEDVLVRIDADYFDKVLKEIVLNSVEAMPFGGNITVRTQVENDKVNIKISDNGSGIEEENMDLIFEPFVTFNKDGHSGFGLAFVRTVVSAMKGSVTAKRRSDKGLTITITLPTVII